MLISLPEGKFPETRSAKIWARKKIRCLLASFFLVYFQGKTEHILDDWKRFMESKQCDAANTPFSNDLGQHPTEGSLAASFFSRDWNGGLVPKLGGFEVRTIAGLGFFRGTFFDDAKGRNEQRVWLSAFSIFHECSKNHQNCQ